MEPAASREAFRGHLVRVEIERWTDPDRTREVVRHPGAVAVVPVTAEGRVILVRQLREAVRRPLLEVPAGILDVEDERPEETARRELREETGYAATSLEPLGRIHTSPGFSDEKVELFLARAEPAGGPELGIEVVEMALEEAVEAVERGVITDAKSSVALLLAERRLRG